MTDSGIVQRVRRSLRGLDRVSALHDDAWPHAVIAALSGGADSLALVLALRDLDRLGLLRLTAVHVDHGVRAMSSDEADTVEAIASTLGVAFRRVAIVPEAIEQHRGVGPEEAMRRERYRQLSTAAEDSGARVIATGHHRRDQAETVMLHLLRGSGLRGMSGMREVSIVDVPWWRDDGASRSSVLWRPLLDEDPRSLRALAESSGLPIIEDASNRSETFRRNALRHRVLPLLDDIAPGSERTLAGFARRAADDDDALESLAQEALNGAGESLSRSLLLGQPVAIQRRMVRLWIVEQAPGLELTYDRSEAVRTLAERNLGGKIVDVGQGWRVLLVRGELMLLVPDEGDR